MYGSIVQMVGYIARLSEKIGFRIGEYLLAAIEYLIHIKIGLMEKGIIKIAFKGRKEVFKQKAAYIGVKSERSL
jgi:hypothetical protein